MSCYQRFEVLALSHSASFDHRWLPEAWRTAMAIFAAVAYREGWEEVLFLLMFLAIWRLATIEPAGDFQPPLSADLVGHKEHAEYASCARESGVATIVTRYLVCAASLQNAEPLLLRAQFIELFERSN